MGIKRLSYEVQKSLRICCAGKQSHLTKIDAQKLIVHPENQLRNLARTYGERLEGQSIYDIREFFHDSDIPFRFEGCSRGSMVCCGSCTKVCKHRCPQDVLNRAFLQCAHIMYNPERYDTASIISRMLYDELTSSQPKYFVIANMVSTVLSPTKNPILAKEMLEIYGNADNPHRLDYAPVIEYELTPGTRPEEARFRKKVNLETGEVLVLHWPRSGVCPFCLPTGLSERRRTK